MSEVIDSPPSNLDSSLCFMQPLVYGGKKTRDPGTRGRTVAEGRILMTRPSAVAFGPSGSGHVWCRVRGVGGGLCWASQRTPAITPGWMLIFPSPQDPEACAFGPHSQLGTMKGTAAFPAQ